MSSLRQRDGDLNFIGRGGPEMRAIAGERFKNWLDDAAVLGLWEVIRKYGYFRKQFRETLKEIHESKPDAVVLIDYPGFNLRLAARIAKTVTGTKDNLLHQPASLGLESRTHQEDGAPSGSRALYLSFRSRSL